MRAFGEHRATITVAAQLEQLARAREVCERLRDGCQKTFDKRIEISIKGLAELVIGILGSKSRIEFIPYIEAYAPGFEDMQRRLPVLQKLAEKVHCKPATPLRKIIEFTAASI
jgi:hypothetical protein